VLADSLPADCWLLTVALRMAVTVAAAVVLPGFYPSRMATGNSTYVLAVEKCPQKYIWCAHVVTCICSTLKFPASHEPRQRLSSTCIFCRSHCQRPANLGADSVQLSTTRSFSSTDSTTSLTAQCMHAACVSTHFGPLSIHRSHRHPCHLPTFCTACMLAAGLCGKCHGARCRVCLVFFAAVAVLEVCRLLLLSHPSRQRWRAPPCRSALMAPSHRSWDPPAWISAVSSRGPRRRVPNRLCCASLCTCMD
jgi:hypothetical protein